MPRVPRHPLRPSPGRAAALPPTRTGPALDRAPTMQRRSAPRRRNRRWQSDDAALQMPVEPTDEDCLFLNVYTPATDDGKRPVMFWIHGGGYVAGSGPRLPRRPAGPGPRCRRRHHQLPHGRPRLHAPRPSRPGARRVRQQRHPRSDRGARVDPGQHPRIRRRPGQRHDLRRVRRRHVDGDAARLSAGRGVVPQGLRPQSARRPDSRRRRSHRLHQPVHRTLGWRSGQRWTRDAHGCNDRSNSSRCRTRIRTCRPATQPGLPPRRQRVVLAGHRRDADSAAPSPTPSASAVRPTCPFLGGGCRHEGTLFAAIVGGECSEDEATCPVRSRRRRRCAAPWPSTSSSRQAPHPARNWSTR